MLACALAEGLRSTRSERTDGEQTFDAVRPRITTSLGMGLDGVLTELAHIAEH